VSGNGVQVTGLSTSAVLGLACAVLSALGTNLAFLYKHRGAVAAPDVDMREPLRSAIDLFRSKWWTIGWVVAAAAFLAHVGALAPPAARLRQGDEGSGSAPSSDCVTSSQLRRARPSATRPSSASGLG